MKRHCAYHDQDEPRNKIIVKIEDRGAQKGAYDNMDYGKDNMKPNNKDGKVIKIPMV